MFSMRPFMSASSDWPIATMPVAALRMSPRPDLMSTYWLIIVLAILRDQFGVMPVYLPGQLRTRQPAQVARQELVHDLPALPLYVLDGSADRREDRRGQRLGVRLAVDARIEVELDQLPARADHRLDQTVLGPGGAGDPPQPPLPRAHLPQRTPA